jgi:hypothetical protein
MENELCVGLALAWHCIDSGVHQLGGILQIPIDAPRNLERQKLLAGKSFLKFTYFIELIFLDQCHCTSRFHVLQYRCLLALTVHAECAPIFSIGSRNSSASSSNRWNYSQRYCRVSTSQSKQQDSRWTGVIIVFGLCSVTREHQGGKLILGIHFPIASAFGGWSRSAIQCCKRRLLPSSSPNFTN